MASTIARILTGAFRQCVLRLAQHFQSQGEVVRAETLYQQSLRVDPSAEVLYRQLMLHLRASGRLTDAMETYRRCEKILAVTMAAKPSAETRAVYEALSRA